MSRDVMAKKPPGGHPRSNGFKSGEHGAQNRWSSFIYFPFRTPIRFLSGSQVLKNSNVLKAVCGGAPSLDRFTICCDMVGPNSNSEIYQNLRISNKKHVYRIGHTK